MKKRILVIEDEQILRSNISELLSIEDFEVHSAEDGNHGLRLAEELQPDLILCDITMPTMDGYSVLDRLRQKPGTATIPFIFLTAWASKADQRRGMELGADDYLTKPFTRSELLGAVKSRLNKQAVIVNHFSSELKRLETELHYMQEHDITTGLPNRVLLNKFFKKSVDTISQEEIIPILVLRLNEFVQLLDNLGPETSDLLIKQVTTRLSQVTQTSGILAFLGNDQFVLLGNPVKQKEAIEVLAELILDSFTTAFSFQDNEVFLQGKMGIACAPADDTELDSLIRNAEAALLYAKKTSKKNYQFYISEFSSPLTERLKMETALRQALERSEFEMYYQPQVSLATGKIVGAEALIRWRHPERGLVPPLEFIGLAEETGLIVPLGEWTLRNVCEQAVKWQVAGMEPLRMAVNLSHHQFSQPDLQHSITNILKSTNFSPEYLELELTESSLVKDMEMTVAALKELKALGIKISMDDFGTGYSSLGYLQQLPMDTLKIDRCFIRNLSRSHENRAITAAIIQMAHTLNLKVVAEGVEIEEERRFLTEHKCDELQGYLFSRPVPAKDFEELVTAEKKLPVLMG